MMYRRADARAQERDYYVNENGRRSNLIIYLIRVSRAYMHSDIGTLRAWISYAGAPEEKFDI